MKDGLLSVICGDGNCSRRATVRLGIDTLIANILVSTEVDGRPPVYCLGTLRIQHLSLSLLPSTGREMSTG